MARQLNDGFIKRLINGDLYQLLNTIKEDKELALQIRDNYINIYYKGGRILEIRPKSKRFDKNYFLHNDNSSKSAIDEGRTQLTDEVKEFDKSLISADSDPKKYFKKAKEVMDKWFKTNKNEERKEQHEQIADNTSSDDYCIIDIEYAVSSTFDYCYKAPTGNQNRKVPRFDIIAINREGQVCVIELKKGLKALEGASGLGGHLQSFERSIARNQESFINHICTLNEQMKELGFQNREIINMNTVKFMFAYKLSNEIDNEKEKFNLESQKQEINDIECIFIEPNSNKILDINKETLTC